MYDRAALRWLERYLTESSPSLRDFAEVSGDTSRIGSKKAVNEQ
jgi:hypothetical protein